MKDILLRIYQNGQTRVMFSDGLDIAELEIMFSDGLDIAELEKIQEHIREIISNKKGLEPKHQQRELEK